MKHLSIVILFLFASYGIIIAQKNGLNSNEKQTPNSPLNEVAAYQRTEVGSNFKNEDGITFEQKRMRQVLAQHAQKQKELNEAVDSGTSLLKKAKEKIKLARNLLETNKKMNKISEEEYLVQKAKISRATKKVKELENKINRSK